MLAWTQAILQPTKVLVLPLALLTVLPFGSALAFYENLTASGAAGSAGGLESRFRRAARLAGLWPRQNHLALLILLLFSIVVFLNIATGLIQVPYLLKTFLGIESVFTRGSWAVLNTTYLAVCVGLAFLCVDPLVKVFYVLRCFHGESLGSGEDLRVGLGRIRALSVGRALLAAWALGLSVARGIESRAAPVGEPPLASAAAIDAGRLDRAIDRVLERREYDWRLPREPKPMEEQGVIGAFISGVYETIRKWTLAVYDSVREAGLWIRDMLDRIRDGLFGSRGGGRSGWGSGMDSMAVTHLLLWACLALVVSGLVIFGWRAWRSRRRAVVPVGAPPAKLPDVADESVLADQLPEDEWLQLGRDLVGRGHLRLAVRAFYLACLARLAYREWIGIARHKSNRDYLVEVRRRAHDLPELQEAFGENVAIFDRVWYGLHEVTAERLSRIQENLERIRAC